jgi:amidase
MNGEPWSWTASELAAAIACGRLSSVEATQSALSRMEAVNPAINAVVDPLPDAALAAARQADAALRRQGPLGPLHGVPVTVKINVDYGSRATTNGVVAYRDLIAPDDGSVVRNLRASGAVIVGRTNTPAFSMRWFTENDLHGATLNPHDTSITPGGSSGGAGAATAAGIGAMGHGNDIGGSVRYPAYCCGLYGLRPTSGLVPAYNPSQLAERPIASQMSSVQGPLARSAADIALAMRALAKYDPRDIWQVPAPAGVFDTARKPCRVAMQAETGECAVEPSVSAAIRQAGAVLADAGYEVIETAIPSMTEAADLWRQVFGSEMRAGLWPLAQQHGDAKTKHSLKLLIETTPDLDRDAFLKTFARRSTLLRKWQLFFEEFPLILTAVSWRPPLPAGYDQRPDLDFEPFYRELSPTTATPILGLPGLTAPVGAVPGKPIGVQLIAGRFGEPLLLSAAAALERATGPMQPVDPAG